jgi:hypothetical protein
VLPCFLSFSLSFCEERAESAVGHSSSFSYSP